MNQANQSDQERRNKIIQMMRENGGEMTFIIGQTSVPVSRCLIALVVEGVIEHINNQEPMARTYRLKDR